MIVRMVVQTTLSLLAMGVILFLSAGDWRWPAGWMFLGEIGAFTFALGFWLARHDPALLASRLSSPVRRDQKPWDRLFLAAAGVAFVAWLMLMALDGRRFGWSRVPFATQLLGGLLIGACMYVCAETFRVNSFAAPQVRMQTDRGHHVISEGPYRFVRHPMYAGAIFLFIGSPLLLGSWWGLAPIPFFVVGVGARAVGEERMLRQELAGYDDYARRVRFRLAPRIW